INAIKTGTCAIVALNNIKATQQRLTERIVIQSIQSIASRQDIFAKTTCQAIITSLTGEGIGQTIAHNGVVEATTNDIFKGSGTS
ncbi:hypothetical protein MAE30S32_39340, partial [Microcystis aeruginosa 11-30S32]